MEIVGPSRRSRPLLAWVWPSGGHDFMKSKFIMVLSGLLLCGCSQKQEPSSAGPAIDRVQAGDTDWPDGPYVYHLHVTRREGTALFGVSISAKLPTGQTQITSGERATLSAVPNAKDDKSVLIMFHDVKIQVGSESQNMGQGDYGVSLHE